VNPYTQAEKAKQGPHSRDFICSSPNQRRPELPKTILSKTNTAEEMDKK
jgi:hypothetical protein